ncbi:hypothetical protein SV7mr_26610 [Stieleria bergensis]|uniref:Uncharacterized protein n=1 Tax=Stieleria bergensis TaxID=2528025 RepID=A0A517SVI7_9BACT|nr:hypothetical protein SV7mr_26610 [Planctomycetes bacterium SV_7m_r]
MFDLAVGDSSTITWDQAGASQSVAQGTAGRAGFETNIVHSGSVRGDVLYGEFGTWTFVSNFSRRLSTRISQHV